jgi:hypothetical protein
MKKQKVSSWDDVHWWREAKEAMSEGRDATIKVGNLGYVRVIIEKEENRLLRKLLKRNKQ